MLRALPHSLQRCPQVSFALQVYAAATQHDCFRFLKLHSEGTWMQQAIMEPRLQQVCPTSAEPHCASFMHVGGWLVFRHELMGIVLLKKCPLGNCDAEQAPHGFNEGVKV